MRRRRDATKPHASELTMDSIGRFGLYAAHYILQAKTTETPQTGLLSLQILVVLERECIVGNPQPSRRQSKLLSFDSIYQHCFKNTILHETLTLT